MIDLTCPNCGLALAIPDEYRGQTGRCIHCKSPIHVPSSAMTRAENEYLNALPDPPRWPSKFGAFIWDAIHWTGRRSLEIFRTRPARTWRDDPMTERQEEFLLDLGAHESQITGFTKGQASDMISHLKGEPVAHDMTALVKAQKAHTNWQKNCCGAVLLVLLAPFWIPACGYIISQGDPENIPQSISEYNAPEQSTTMVYAAQSGRVYHRKDCGRIDGPVESMTIATAEANGMVPCGICQPEL